MRPQFILAIAVAMIAGTLPSKAQNPSPQQQPAQTTPAPAARGTRPPPPTRDPNTPGYVKATELPDGAVPAADAYGNFIIGPTHNPAPEMTAQPGVPQGKVETFTMESTASKIYPGIARDQGTFGTPDPQNPAKLDVTTSSPDASGIGAAAHCARIFSATIAAPAASVSGSTITNSSPP